MWKRKIVFKKCCVSKCKSKSTRKEDVRVTYHKFPKDESVRNTWVQVTRYAHTEVDLNTYVCSRHFLLTNFEHDQGRYVLKSGAVPSIFPWTNMDELDSLAIIEDVGGDKRNLSTSSKESEPENLEAIKNFIENHDGTEKPQDHDKMRRESEKTNNNKKEVVESTTDSNDQTITPSNTDEPIAIATSVMDFILNDSADKLSKSSESSQDTTSTSDKSSSVALSVGSRVEAKDFSETWYSAEIIEVDYDEMEVLVRFESITKKSEEWINVNSPRLRPATGITSADTKTELSSIEENNLSMKKSNTNQIEIAQPVKVDEKVENKLKVTTFAVGEKCLARWRDNRRFVATIENDLGNGTYGIIFDDGFHWKCSGNRLSKLKDHVDCPSGSRACLTPSPTPGSGPSTSTATVPEPTLHKHLFDPTRDYLGSKSERRELKRKLNIKEIFNIGQKQRKKEPVAKVKKERPKMLNEKKPRSHKKKTELGLKAEVVLDKKNVPDAVASIIGTVDNSGDTNISNEKENVASTSKEKNNVEKESDVIVSDEDTQSIKSDYEEFDDNDVDFFTDPDGKMSIDKIQEEDRLQNFEKPDDVKHEQVIDRIKEAINKLEDDINKTEVSNDPPPLAGVALDTKKETNEMKQEMSEVKHEPSEIVVEAGAFTKASSKTANEISEVTPGTSRITKQEIGTTTQETSSIKQETSDTKDTLNEAAKETSEETKQETSPGKLKIKLNKKSKKVLKYEKRIKLLEQEKAGAIELFSTKLANMKKEMDEIRMMFGKATPESFLLEGEWCCKWVNGEPMGTVVEAEPDNRVDVINKLALPKKTVQVEDKRLPEGWSKLMVRRSFGNSAGKWDVVLVSPDKRRFHTKTDMRNYLENNADPALKACEGALLDFSVHLKLARRMGWVKGDTGHASRGLVGRPVPQKRTKLMLKRGAQERKAKKRKLSDDGKSKLERNSTQDSSLLDSSANIPFDNSTLEDGYVYVGSLKVQVIDNLLRCPAEGCFKNFRNNTLLQMHIKHYHMDLCQSLGATPKVLDLAYARTVPTETETRQRYEPDNKIIKVKIPRPPKRLDESKLEMKEVNISQETRPDVSSPVPTKVPKTDPPKVPKTDPPKIPRSLDSPMMRQMTLQATKRKRPKVLLPVRRPEPAEASPELPPSDDVPEYELDTGQIEPKVPVPTLQILDFETAISTHTVARVVDKRRPDKRKVFATISKAPLSEDEEGAVTSDVETRSSCPGSGTPDSKTTEPKSATPTVPLATDMDEESMYIYTESGERIKLERMKREEIINCHCGFREEDGLMVQCDLCLCWQHALCHNIQREADVPQKYMCSICLNPARGRRSRRHLHDQERMSEGALPGARPAAPLRRSHELAAHLLAVADALHAVRVKWRVATTKNHPKLYLWAKDWDAPEPSAFAHEHKHDPYSELNVIVNNVGSVSGDSSCGVGAGRAHEDEGAGVDRSPGSLLGGLLASPGGGSMDMPISTSELERLAKSVQEQAECRAPQPEAAIEDGACRERLLRHVQRCQALVDARLDTLEAEIVELESQEPSFEDDETADYFPRTKQTIQMLLRDLETLQMLGLVT